ncbi:MAG: NUDIX domain-containing protein [Victivallaceae bacterium]|nr:NUDIX domain-containing protein [Victivallaceae bacterium]
MKRIEVAAAVIRRAGRVLMTSRPPDKPPEGWEFPGGKLEPGESANEALEREMLEELGCRVVAADEIFRVESLRGDRLIVLHFLRAFLLEHETPEPREGQQYSWVALSGAAPAGLLGPDLPVWRFIALDKR